MIARTSASDYQATLAALLAAIGARGLTVFTRVDHAAGARGVGLELEDEEVVAFGNPKSGTPLMQEDRRVGLELPLRMLVWRAGGGVFVGYNDPRGLAADYDLAGHASTLEQMAVLLEALAAEATGSSEE